MNKRLLLLILPVAISAQAQPSSCSSDGVSQPSALLERFTSADCANCWASRQAPEPASGALAIDWVTPGSRGDEAPLSAVATRDSVDRIEATGTQPPLDTTSRFTARAGSAYKLRVAHGLAINDYVGASIEVAPPVPEGWTAWLLLIETLPKGSEGSSVERNLVRNAFVATRPGRYEIRSMQIPEGARPSRLRVVGWLQDPQGKIRAIAHSRCRKS